MLDHEKPVPDPSGNDSDVDDGVSGDTSAKSTRLSNDGVRSKSEQDLVRANSLAMLMVC